MVLKHTAATESPDAEITYVQICLVTVFPSMCLSVGAGTAASLEESAGFLSFHELSELMQALPGFLMLLTGEGKLLYLSDSVSEHLGHSMVSPHRAD